MRDRHVLGLDPGSMLVSGAAEDFEGVGWIIRSRDHFVQEMEQSAEYDGSRSWLVHHRMARQVRNRTNKVLAGLVDPKKMIDLDQVALLTNTHVNDILYTLDDQAGAIVTDGVSGCYLPLARTSKVNGFKLGHKAVRDVIGITLFMNQDGSLFGMDGTPLVFSKVGEGYHISRRELDDVDEVSLQSDSEVNGAPLNIML